MVKCKDCRKLIRVLEVLQYRPFKAIEIKGSVPLSSVVRESGNLTVVGVEYECAEGHDTKEEIEPISNIGYLERDDQDILVCEKHRAKFTLRIDEERECEDFEPI